ncbi:hypothetical protein QQF64_022588 [Cirrhinus molitorella]|uniref:Uncharacterized protein n=1 Tax=Cirrhinus molitorella TaxID=172907 RepID=A0ABR3L6C4_9TELE
MQMRQLTLNQSPPHTAPMVLHVSPSPQKLHPCPQPRTVGRRSALKSAGLFDVISAGLSDITSACCQAPQSPLLQTS